ncbi:uncharacterized protein LOC128261868 [Drosophila gunungcola]|uniref:Uncharacterized protein n=1 Tax=Drosophila gunungcola TaxID=103775 RepID=A0A9Q0BVV9_9MUSC|nr:uncharacterized protein LOC128261868 [Drosophila gunungcola]KAI8046492.1 hypothetical protein M5D96_002702 [Drosophila gunungcola]
MILSRKEIVSLLLLLTAILCVLNASLFANILPLHVSYEQLAQQVVCVGTAYICVIYALSTWMYHSNYSRTRLHMRMVLVTMLLGMMVCNTVATYYFSVGLAFTKLEETMNLYLLFSSFAVASKSVSLGLSVISIFLLFVIMVLIVIKMMQKHGKHSLEEKLQNVESQKE